MTDVTDEWKKKIASCSCNDEKQNKNCTCDGDTQQGVETINSEQNENCACDCGCDKEQDEESIPNNKEAKEINWEEEASKYKDLYVRNAAETDNMRRRFQKEKIEQLKYAEESIIKDILPILDNLELALQYVKDDADEATKALAEGVEMTLKGALGIFKEYGLLQVEAEDGMEFDSNIHEALSQVSDNCRPKGTIVQVMQKGYMLNERLVRPAKVIVSAGSLN